MDMQGSRPLAVTQQQAWDALNDPEVLKACIAGCDRIEATEPNHYVIGMALKIGPVSAKFTGKIALAEIVPPESYTLSFDGQGGVAGFGKGNAQVKLSANPTGPGCELAYTVHAQVGGKIAQLGQRLIDGAAKSMAEDFFKRFDGEMQRKYPAPAVDADAGAPTAGATAAASGADARKALPAWVWVAAVIALGVLAWWAGR